MRPQLVCWAIVDSRIPEYILLRFIQFRGYRNALVIHQINPVEWPRLAE
jgi:hypothetical protein